MSMEFTETSLLLDPYRRKCDSVRNFWKDLCLMGKIFFVSTVILTTIIIGLSIGIAYKNEEIKVLQKELNECESQISTTTKTSAVFNETTTTKESFSSTNGGSNPFFFS
ncbi:UNVERIFIED_CONTAM: hypothetical protein RMT77_001666 [Armadillidium vulgare]